MTDQPTVPVQPVPPVIPGNGPTIAGSPWLTDEITADTPPTEPPLPPAA